MAFQITVIQDEDVVAIMQEGNLTFFRIERLGVVPFFDQIDAGEAQSHYSKHNPPK